MDEMQFHTTEQLGPTQALTPDGFLLCSGVAIARTGTQRYSPLDFEDGKAPIEPGPDGMLQIAREEDQVFDPRTIASFEGKPVTVDHIFVTPENFQDAAVGHAQNIRRGTGIENDLLIADLLITDSDAIEKVREGLREVSCGYDADYEQISPGRGRQHNIIGNHIALVPRGRAGPRCSIQDKEPVMPQTFKEKLLALVRKAPTKDADLENAIASMDEETDEEKEKRLKEEAKDAKTADSIATLAKTVDALVQSVAALTKTKDGEETDEEKVARLAAEKKTADDLAEEEAEARQMVGDSISRAEILAPGFQMPTTDSIKTRDGVVALQRKVLSTVVATDAGKTLLAPFLGKRTVDALSADAVSAAFVAASQIAGAVNNAKGFTLPAKTADRHIGNQIESINQANKAFWSNAK